MSWITKRWPKEDHNTDTNWPPPSAVMCSGTLNCVTHELRADAQDVYVLSHRYSFWSSILMIREEVVKFI